MERIVIGRECIGSGICESLDPEVFEVTDDGVSSVLVDGVPEDHRATITEAVDRCPSRAIRLTSDD
jgi:ferredoxin